MRHIDTACRERRFKTCRMCSSSIFWAEGYGNTWQNPVWRAWRKKMNITSLQCQETGDLLRQGREKCTGFQGWFAWKVSWKDSNCHIFCSYLNWKWRNKYPDLPTTSFNVVVSLTACLHWTPSFHCYSLLIVILGPFYILWTCIILCQVCHSERTHCKLKTKGLNQPRQRTHITKWYQTCTECLDASHQYQRLQSKQIQSLCQMYSNSISPGERLREICQKHGERK